MKKMSLFLLALLSSNVAEAGWLNPNSIYNYAKTRNYRSLQRFSKWINVTDENGDTAVCLALKNNDKVSYNILVKYGADPKPGCYNDGTFLGMGKTGWLTTGAIVAVGAAAAGGGGGGGGASSGSSGTGGNEGGSSGTGGNEGGSSGTGGNEGGSGGAGGNEGGSSGTGGNEGGSGGAGGNEGGSGGAGGNEGGSGGAGGNEGGSSGSGGNEGGSSGSGDDEGISKEDFDTNYLDNEKITDQDKGQEIVGKTVTIQDPQTNKQYLANSNNGTIKKIVESESDVVGLASETAFVANATTFSGSKTANIILAQRGSGDVYGIKGPQSSHVNVIPDDEDDDED